MKKILFTLLFLMPFFARAQEVYHIKWISSGDVLYSAAVILYDDDTGSIRVRYDAGSGEKLVEMDAALEEGYLGFYINGSNPRNVLTTGPANYNADHFYVWADDEGEINCANSDDGDSESSCCIMEVEGDTNRNIFLKEFNWTLD